MVLRFYTPRCLLSVPVRSTNRVTAADRERADSQGGLELMRRQTPHHRRPPHRPVVHSRKRRIARYQQANANTSSTAPTISRHTLPSLPPTRQVPRARPSASRTAGQVPRGLVPR